MPIDWTLVQTMRRNKALAPLSEPDRAQIQDLSAPAIGLNSGARHALWERLSATDRTPPL